MPISALFLWYFGSHSESDLCKKLSLKLDSGAAMSIVLGPEYVSAYIIYIRMQKLAKYDSE